MKKKIFLDLDGVWANFHDGVKIHTGKDITHYKGNDKLLWAHLREVDNLFFSLPILEGSLALRDYLMDHDHDYEYLTAVPRPEGKLAQAAEDKRRWVHKHLTTHIPVTTVVGGKNKYKHLERHPGAILIDDYKRNLDLWVEHGGIAVHHRTVEETIEQLRALNIGFK